MNTKSVKSFTFISAALLLFAHASNAQAVNAQYGSAISGTTISLFTDEAKIGYDSGNAGLFALGYFNDGFNVANEAANVSDSATLSNFLGSFNVLHETSFNIATAAGFLSAAEPNLGDSAGIGKETYILTLGGISSYSQSSSATEIGLFRDSDTFGVLPAGEAPIAKDYNITSTTYSDVILGSEFLGEALSGGFTGFSGNIYASQALGNAVPEPSTYALFLGIFSIGFVYWRKRTAKTASQEQS